MEFRPLREGHGRIDREFAAARATEPDEMRSATIVPPHVVRQAAGIGPCGAYEFKFDLTSFDADQRERLDVDVLGSGLHLDAFAGVTVHGAASYLLGRVSGDRLLHQTQVFLEDLLEAAAIQDWMGIFREGISVYVKRGRGKAEPDDAAINLVRGKKIIGQACGASQRQREDARSKRIQRSRVSHLLYSRNIADFGDNIVGSPPGGLVYNQNTIHSFSVDRFRLRRVDAVKGGLRVRWVALAGRIFVGANYAQYETTDEHRSVLLTRKSFAIRQGLSQHSWALLWSAQACLSLDGLGTNSTSKTSGSRLPQPKEHSGP